MNLDEKFIKLSLSYLSLRKTVGWIGISLPFVLILGKIILFPGNGIPTSISHYYYTGMRDVMVGALCAVALFLFFYEGYDEWDEWMGNLAAIFALGAALFPTTEYGKTDIVGIIHNLSAALFFLCLALFSLFLFTRKNGEPTHNKHIRNRIYITCGVVMVLSLSTIIVVRIWFDIGRTHIDFWAECIALVAFGVSWLTKGGTLYPDTKTTPVNEND
jgi:hypothetical protein